MSPGPPSTAPSIRWPRPPYNDYAVRCGPPPRSGWSVPNPALGDLSRHAIDPAWRRRHRTLAPVRAENLVRGSDQQGCLPGHLAVRIAGHVPAVRLPRDHERGLMAAAVPARGDLEDRR